MQKSVKIMTVTLAIVMVIGCASVFMSCKTNGGLTDFTFWIPAHDGGSYYSDHSDNPVARYLTEVKEWNGSQISIEWQVPPAGKEQDNIGTALTSDQYADVIDASYITNIKSINELYDDGYILDISSYVEEYMPNYRAFLAAHPDLAKTAVNIMPDGSKKYLQIWAYQGEEGMWGGWQYRRDWLVKYGTNPSTGVAFSGGYTGTDRFGKPDYWEDDVKFPSWYDTSVKEWYLADVDPNWDGSLPVTIDDWTWMLGIFAKALDGEGISNGYGMQMYQPGYYELGDLVGSFGGGGATWYLNEDKTTAYFGLTSSNFRYYLDWMSDIYALGYVDKAFTEHNDMFYQIDQTKVAQGKVGLWYGLQSQLGAQMDTNEGKPNNEVNGYTNGICVYAARQPINTSYGTEENQRKIPTVMYQTTEEMRSFVVTDKAAKKDLAALFTFMDYMYTEEGSLLSCYGLSAEQYKEYKQVTGKTSSIMEKFVDENGAIYTIGEAGVLYTDKIENDDQQSALRASRFMGYANRNEHTDHSRDNYTQTKFGTDEYVFFRNKGAIPSSLTTQISTENSNIANEIVTDIRSYAAQNVYKYIKVGTSGYTDIMDDSVWNAWCARINGAYHPERYTQILQDLLDLINN